MADFVLGPEEAEAGEIEDIQQQVQNTHMCTHLVQSTKEPLFFNSSVTPIDTHLSSFPAANTRELTAYVTTASS